MRILDGPSRDVKRFMRTFFLILISDAGMLPAREDCMPCDAHRIGQIRASGSKKRGGETRKNVGEERRGGKTSGWRLRKKDGDLGTEKAALGERRTLRKPKPPASKKFGRGERETRRHPEKNAGVRERQARRW
jgi:hypothetical protein